MSSSRLSALYTSGRTLVPATLLQSILFQERFDRFILLHARDMFLYTNDLVALALFKPPVALRIYYDETYGHIWASTYLRLNVLFLCALTILMEL